MLRIRLKPRLGLLPAGLGLACSGRSTLLAPPVTTDIIIIIIIISESTRLVIVIVIVIVTAIFAIALAGLCFRPGAVVHGGVKDLTRFPE